MIDSKFLFSPSTSNEFNELPVNSSIVPVRPMVGTMTQAGYKEEHEAGQNRTSTFDFWNDDLDAEYDRM